MAGNDISKLSRKELLELLIDQGKEIERLRSELARTNASLRDRRIEMNEAGTMAEAAVRMNRVFEAADAAAAQYLENIKQLEQEKQKECDAILGDAREQAARLLADAEAERSRLIHGDPVFPMPIFDRIEILDESK